MTSKHSPTSPSNFHRRLLCPGSLCAEKDLPEVSSKYAQTGTMLHERVNLNIIGREWDKDLTKEEKKVVSKAATYYKDLKRALSLIILEQHEIRYDLSFLIEGMSGSADSVLFGYDQIYNICKLHVIDYKFGKNVEVKAKNNWQLYLYYLGVINNEQIRPLLQDTKYKVYLHIVQPYIKNGVWHFTDEDAKEFNEDKVKATLQLASSINAKRTPYKEACMFCKAKATCNEYQDNKRNLISKEEELWNERAKQLSKLEFQEIKNN